MKAHRMYHKCPRGTQFVQVLLPGQYVNEQSEVVFAPAPTRQGSSYFWLLMRDRLLTELSKQGEAQINEPNSFDTLMIFSQLRDRMAFPSIAPLALLSFVNHSGHDRSLSIGQGLIVRCAGHLCAKQWYACNELAADLLYFNGTCSIHKLLCPITHLLASMLLQNDRKV